MDKKPEAKIASKKIELSTNACTITNPLVKVDKKLLETKKSHIPSLFPETMMCFERLIRISTGKRYVMRNHTFSTRPNKGRRNGKKSYLVSMITSKTLLWYPGTGSTNRKAVMQRVSISVERRWGFWASTRLGYLRTKRIRTNSLRVSISSKKLLRNSKTAMLKSS